MRGYRAIALTISTSIFMQFHDSTALNTAIPTIADALGAPVLHMDVAILAYQIMLVLFVPVATLVAGRIGARNAFALALFVFMCGSLLCAMAGSLPVLAAARAVQGVGGAVMMPIGRLIVVRSAQKSELISAMNWLLVPGILGPILGPAVGGFIVQYSSWHWIFLINVPIALIGIVMTLTLVPDIREEKVDRFDSVGMLLLSPFMIAIVLGLGGLTGRLPLWAAASLLVAALFFGAAYRRHARAAAAPILDLSLLSVPSFRDSTIASTLIRVTFVAGGFLMPLWFQLAMGMTASQAGLLLLMTSIGALFSRLASGPLLRVAEPRTIGIFGAAGLALMLTINAGLRPDWPAPLLYILLAAQGFAMAISMLVLTPATYVDIGPDRMAAATSFYTTLQQLTMSLGVIVGVWTLTAMRWATHATPHDNAAYSGSMLILALMAVGGTLISRRLDRQAMAALRPQREGA